MKAPPSQCKISGLKTAQLAAVIKTFTRAAANTGVRLPLPTGSRNGRGFHIEKGWINAESLDVEGTRDV